ncbi:NAD-dependent protein deacylase [Paraglaciecola aquimarina]|uniref:NAD-dependent protein deacylase n=1 Tax=Paraglaciecola algarum TaxID=3050085 RepID=A0ABS9D947_9ALTE|nr:NAD-dependent protein deacylase [Paraglaciecola sp. G1-23]
MLTKFVNQSLDNLKVVVLTGAGISAESGLKTFRDNNGLWENHSIQEVATPEGFAANPQLVYRFYNQRRRQLLSREVTPNSAHFALAKLEQVLGDRFTLVTQNVDNLHQQAGSQNVLHMHGSLLSAKCVKSENSFKIESDLELTSRCTCCHPKNILRPDIVWFGEMPKYMQSIDDALFDADVFLSIGTSGTVYPAAGFVDQANQYGAHSVELNLEPSSAQSQFAEKHYGVASELVPKFVEQILQIDVKGKSTC